MSILGVTCLLIICFYALMIEEFEAFEPEWLIVNAPSFMAVPKEDGTRQHNFAILDFTRKIALNWRNWLYRRN